MASFSQLDIARFALVKAAGDEDIARLVLLQGALEGPASLIATRELAREIQDRRDQQSRYRSERDAARQTISEIEKERVPQADRAAPDADALRAALEQAEAGLSEARNELSVQKERLDSSQEELAALRAEADDLKAEAAASEDAKAALEIMTLAFRKSEMSDAEWSERISKTLVEVRAASDDEGKRALALFQSFETVPDPEFVKLLRFDEDTPRGQIVKKDREAMLDQAQDFLDKAKDRLFALMDGKAVPALQETIEIKLPARKAEDASETAEPDTAPAKAKTARKPRSTKAKK